MDVTYNASDAAKRAEIVNALTVRGYKTTANGPKRLAYQLPVRVWRVEPADEETVIAAILAVDPGAKPVIPVPAYTTG